MSILHRLRSWEGFLLAALLGGIFPNAGLDKTRTLTWRAVVKGEKTPPT